MSTPSITSIIVGAIKETEDQVIVQINCNPERPDLDGSGAFTNAISDVVIPRNGQNFMPLSGGAIIRISPSATSYTFKKSDTKSYDLKVQSIKDNILSKYLPNNLTDISFAGYKELADLRISLNRTFYEISKFLGSGENFYEKDGVPEFILSSVFSPGTATELQNTYNANKQKNVRDENLSPFLSFQFIPFEIILEIYSRLSVTRQDAQDASLTIGTGTFVGNLGIQFSEIYKKLKDLNDNPGGYQDDEAQNIISAAILEILPYYRIGEEVIIAESDDKLQLGGYYTFFNSNFYIKTPDLSGRDSTEYYSNFTTRENDGIKESLFYILEILVKGDTSYEYCPLVLKYNQLPSLTLKDGEMTYPDSFGNQFDNQIIYTGLDSLYVKDLKNELNVFNKKFYLSPLIKSEIDNNNISKQNNEFSLDKTLEINYSQPIEIATVPLDRKASSFTISKKNPDIVNNLFLKYGTVPLFEKEAATYGVSSADTLLSSLNRPEIAVVDRESNKLNEAREVLLYSTQQSYTRYIISGNSPRFLFSIKTKQVDNKSEIDFSKDFYVPSDLTSQVPTHWIELDHSISTESDQDIILQLSANGKSKLREYFKAGEAPEVTATKRTFDIGDPNNKISFATYVFDSVTGQFVRLPGPNINISLGEAKITEISPNGFLGGSPIRTNDSIKIDIIGENLGDAEAAYIISGGTGDKLIAKKGDPGFSASANLVKINIEKKWSEITTNLGDFPIYLKVKNAKNKETNKDIVIHISADSATSATLPAKGVDKINFISLNSIYYQPKGKAKDLVETQINVNGPDSIPVLFSGNNVKIRVGSNSGIFSSQNKNNIFAYLAFKGSDAKSLVETFGLKEDVISITVNGETYYSNKKISWYFGDQNFSSNGLSNFADLSFPGPIEYGAYNVRSLVEGPLKPQKGYFIFSNEIITSDYNVSLSEADKYYPVSILQIGADELDRPAFVNPPHILGLLARVDGREDGVCNFDIRNIQSATKQSKSGIEYKIKKEIPLRMFLNLKSANIKNEKISIKKTLDHFFILFNAPRKDKKYYKDCYRFYIGSKNITGSLSGKIKYISNNIACAYFRNISSLNLGGYSNVSISVSDYEYNSNYGSEVYTKVSKTLTSSQYQIVESNDSKQIKLNGNLERRIETYDSNFSPRTTSLVLPIVNSGELFRYQRYGYLAQPSPNVASSSSTAIYTAATRATGPSDLYIRFISPIKIRPINLELTFGNLDSITNAQDVNKVFGAYLSDGVRKKNVANPTQNILEENVIITNYSTVDILQSRVDAAAIAESVLAETAKKSADIFSRNNDVTSNSGSSSAELSLAIESNNSLLDLSSATASLQEILDNVNSTAAEIAAAVELVNSLFRKASALTDALSSANFSLSGLVDSALDSTTGPSGRSTLINSLNQYYCYLPETIEYNEAFISQSTSNELLVVATSLIEQTHVIESSIPEVYSITTTSDGKEYFPDSFGDVKLGSSPLEITVKVKGGDLDSKFELGGYRCSSRFDRIDGEIYIYNVIVEPSIYTLTFAGSDCAKFGITNSNRDRLKAERVLDPTAGQDIDKFFDKAKSAIDKQSKKVLDRIVEEKGKLKVGPVIYDKAMATKEALKSFCDMSFHLTAEVSAQLKFLKILYIPIKVIFCIIDVICALLHPVKLAFAVIRLFACLFDLILLLPQISMPVLFLTIALHILELLLCVIHKILGIVVAINEIVTALDTAVRRRDFESIKNLELALNEHLLTIEADLQVLEPILQILGLILELLQLAFSFPCQITQDEDEPACIDPSMLAGLIVSKIAPKGVIVPDAMIPLAQDYTNLPVDRTGENGNTPDSQSSDPEEILDVDYNNPPEAADGTAITNVLFKVSEAVGNGTVTVVADNSSFAGAILPDLVDSQTNENKTVINGGFFSGDQNGDSFIDNINYGKLRFANGEFDASFGISCTKSKKRFSFGTATLDQKNDPRFVEFQFKSAGLTSDYAWTIIGIFFKKKIIDDLFTLDSPPAMLRKNGNKLEIHNGSDINKENIKLISPIDGFSDFIEYAGPGSDGTHTYRAKPLVANIEVIESTINPVTKEPVTTTTTVTKTFGGIPSFAIVDERFNVYFIEENGLAIRFDEIDGIKYPVIDNIFAKMINFPAAETQKFDREERQVIRKTASYQQKAGLFKSKIVDDLLVYCAQGGNPNTGIFNVGYKEELGDAILKMQANAAYFEGLSIDTFLDIDDTSSPSWLNVEDDKTLFGSSSPIGIFGEPDGSPPTPYTIYINYRKLNDELFSEDGATISSSSGYIGVNGATRLANYLSGLVSPGSGITFEFPYPEHGVYDFANGSWAENDDFQYAINTIDVYNFPQIHFVDLRQVADDIAAACGASQTNELLLDLPGFTLDFGGDVVEPYLGCLRDFRDFFVGDNGIVSKIKNKLASGSIPDPISIVDVRATYDNLVACTTLAIDDACKFVINPLNTTFKLIEDSDETDLEEYVDPSTVVTEVVTDGAVSTMPTITGAMEYASGIGDSVTIKAGESATIQIIPRDSYDDEIIESLDARQKISITIVSDTTSGASIEKVDSEQEFLWSKTGSVYTAKITSKTPGKVTLKASICNVVIQAVTDRGISTSITTSGDSSDCIPDAADATVTTTPEIFPPGALVKVDRILTVLFTANNFNDNVDDSGSENPVIMPQVAFTDMVN